MLIVAALVVVTAMAAVVLTGGSSTNQRRRAPDLPKQVLAGGPVRLTALRGRPVIVNFWASWCAPCKRELPELERLSKLLHGRATLVGVDWGDSADRAHGFIRKFGLTYPILGDTDNSVGNDYGLRGLPTTFLIDRDGRISATLRGPQTVETIEHALRGLR
jgi:cytochrome c biogenesis protein CcmG/thiol:disulfide interchange protein DsbE